MRKRISLVALAATAVAISIFAVRAGAAGRSCGAVAGEDPSTSLRTDAGSPTAGAKQDGNVVTIRMEGKKFIPEQITIHSGDTVEWVNEPSGRKHQVTTDPQLAMDANNVSMPKEAKPFDSGTVKAGESYRYRFTVPGTYRYSCPPHEMSGMVGTVVVQP